SPELDVRPRAHEVGARHVALDRDLALGQRLDPAMRASTVTAREPHDVADAETTHGRVMRRRVVEHDAPLPRAWRVEGRYGRATRTLHHVPSTSSATTCHPPAANASSIVDRSSSRMPLRIASPSTVSASAIRGNSSSSTDD